VTQRFSPLILILRGALAGVAQLHKDSVIHRDIAARNFLVDQDLTVKIAGASTFIPF
jgi:serine/threonine protein kinase